MSTILGNKPISCGTRDAVHVATLSLRVAVGDQVYPGQPVGTRDGATADTDKPHYGIVDPFLDHPIRQGECFQMLLYPGTISDLKHQWEHPGIDDEAEDDSYECQNC